STLLTLAYFARLVERMFFREPSVDLEPAAKRVDARADGGEDATGVSFGMQATVVAAAVLAVALGFAVFGYSVDLQPTIEALLS
ncbi:monovalent cation/H+ antiporter subunit D family protein, partial [Halobacterium sp. KA-4]|nr:monovalent cation/H+ antiporter subunit D family protein [Halobacterium sp. KA-4]